MTVMCVSAGVGLSAMCGAVVGEGRVDVAGVVVLDVLALLRPDCHHRYEEQVARGITVAEVKMFPNCDIRSFTVMPYLWAVVSAGKLCLLASDNCVSCPVLGAMRFGDILFGGTEYDHFVFTDGGCDLPPWVLPPVEGWGAVVPDVGAVRNGTLSYLDLFSVAERVRIRTVYGTTPLVQDVVLCEWQHLQTPRVLAALSLFKTGGGCVVQRSGPGSPCITREELCGAPSLRFKAVDVSGESPVVGGLMTRLLLRFGFQVVVPEVPGLCYLRMFEEVSWDKHRAALGVWPTVEQVSRYLLHVPASDIADGVMNFDLSSSGVYHLRFESNEVLWPPDVKKVKLVEAMRLLDGTCAVGGGVPANLTSGTLLVSAVPVVVGGQPLRGKTLVEPLSSWGRMAASFCDQLGSGLCGVTVQVLKGGSVGQMARNLAVSSVDSRTLVCVFSDIVDCVPLQTGADVSAVGLDVGFTRALVCRGTGRAVFRLDTMLSTVNLEAAVFTIDNDQLHLVAKLLHSGGWFVGAKQVVFGGGVDLWDLFYNSTRLRLSNGLVGLVEWADTGISIGSIAYLAGFEKKRHWEYFDYYGVRPNYWSVRTDDDWHGDPRTCKGYSMRARSCVYHMCIAYDCEDGLCDEDCDSSEENRNSATRWFDGYHIS